MLIKPLHPKNALSPMLVTLSGITILVKPLHPKNAYSPMLVTLSGIVMLFKPLHPENAQSPMLAPPVTITFFNDSGTPIPNM